MKSPAGFQTLTENRAVFAEIFFFGGEGWLLNGRCCLVVGAT